MLQIIARKELESKTRAEVFDFPYRLLWPVEGQNQTPSHWTSSVDDEMHCKVSPKVDES
jgi:hypothetical protein